MAVPTVYTEEVNVTIAYVNGEFIECGKIKSRDILPDIASNGEKGKLYYITPLHFGERCLGYMAIRSTKHAMQNIMFQTLRTGYFFWHLQQKRICTCYKRYL